MKTNHRSITARRKGERGSILVICMVLAGLGTLGAAAFFSLMDAKMMEAEQANTANERRAKRANSLALAKEIVQRRYIAAGTGPASAETHTLPGGWGECTISPFAGTPMGTTAATRTHKTGSTPHKAYSFNVDVQIGDGDIQHPRQFQIKSYNPMLGGDLLYMGQPTIDGGAANTLGGNVNVKGRARFWTGGSKHAVTIKADEYVGVDPAIPVLALNDTSGQPVIAQNFLFPDITSGRHGGSPTAAFDGTSSVIVNPDVPWNTYATKVADLGGTSIDGTTPFLTSNAPETRPPTPDDPALITAVNSLSGSTMANAIWDFRPVSSDVMRAVIARQDVLSDGVYAGILGDHGPLPQDIMQLVVDGTVVIGQAHLKWIYEVNPVGVRSDGAGTVVVDLDESTSPHLQITNDVTTIQLKGQDNAIDLAAAATMDPLILVAHNPAASTKILSRIEFQGSNNRPIILAIKNENSNAPVTLAHTGSNFPEWRMVATLENVPITADLSGVNSVTLKGGIWTDRSFEVPAGTLTIERETDPGDLEWMTTRVAWLEVFRN